MPVRKTIISWIFIGNFQCKFHFDTLKPTMIAQIIKNTQKLRHTWCKGISGWRSGPGAPFVATTGYTLDPIASGSFPPALAHSRRHSSKRALTLFPRFSQCRKFNFQIRYNWTFACRDCQYFPWKIWMKKSLNYMLETKKKWARKLFQSN